MGHSITPTFRAEVKANIGHYSSFSWDCKVNGRPSQKNVDSYRVHMNRSFAPGGVNDHISQSRGVIPHISEVKVIRQSTGEVVATSNAPMFEVV